MRRGRSAAASVTSMLCSVFFLFSRSDFWLKLLLKKENSRRINNLKTADCEGSRMRITTSGAGACIFIRGKISEARNDEASENDSFLERSGRKARERSQFSICARGMESSSCHRLSFGLASFPPDTHRISPSPFFQTTFLQLQFTKRAKDVEQWTFLFLVPSSPRSGIPLVGGLRISRMWRKYVEKIHFRTSINWMIYASGSGLLWVIDWDRV